MKYRKCDGLSENQFRTKELRPKGSNVGKKDIELPLF